MQDLFITAEQDAKIYLDILEKDKEKDWFRWTRVYSAIMEAKKGAIIENVRLRRGHYRYNHYLNCDNYDEDVNNYDEDVKTSMVTLQIISETEQEIHDYNGAVDRMRKVKAFVVKKDDETMLTLNTESWNPSQLWFEVGSFFSRSVFKLEFK